MNMKQFSLKTLVVILGTLMMAIGINLLIISGQGVDPLSTFLDGVTKHIPMELGTMIAIFNAIVLVIIFFIERRHIGLGSFINGIVTGIFSNMLMAAMQPLNALPTIVLVLFGTLVFSFGIALYMNAMLGLGTIEATMLILTVRTGISATKIRTAMDLGFIIGGILLGATFGYGTIVSAVFNGKLIGIFTNLINKTK